MNGTDSPAHGPARLFALTVADAMAPPPIVVGHDLPLGEVAAELARAGVSAALVRDADGRLAGILTEQDMTRRVAFRLPAEAPAEQAMSAPLDATAPDLPLYHALVAMRRAGRRHLPVLDGTGTPVGMLQLDGALAAASGRLLARAERLSRGGSLPALVESRRAQAEIAEEMLADGIAGPEVQSFLSGHNNEVYGRVGELVLAEMARDGLGPPPLRFALIVLGSGGRGESLLHPDQDNGLVLEDYPDDRHDAVDAWFRAFAARLTAGMDAVGLPLCRGHVMATNPLWRKSLSQWRGQLDYWLAHRNPAVLRWADIFFDFRGVWGEPGLAGALRETVTDRLAGNVRFLRAMVRDDEDNDVALGLFHRFVLERSDPATRGRVNLKLGATLPLTDSVRVLALRQGIAETSTLARIAGLLEAGVLDSDEADALSAGYAEISAMLLRQQLADWRAGRPLGNHVDPHALTGRERDHLVAALKAIRGVLDLARMELTGFVL